MGRNKMWHKASKELSHLLRHPHEHPTLAHLVDLATGYMKIQDCVLLLKIERQELLRMIQSSVRDHGRHPGARFQLSSDETLVRAVWRPWQEDHQRLTTKEVPSLTGTLATQLAPIL